MNEVNVNDHEENVEVVHQSFESDLAEVTHPLSFLKHDHVWSSEQLNVLVLGDLLKERSAQNLRNGHTVIVHLLELVVRLVLSHVVQTFVKEFIRLEFKLLLSIFFRNNLITSAFFFFKDSLKHLVIDVNDLGVWISHVWQKVEQAFFVNHLAVQQKLHVSSQVQNVSHSSIEQVSGDLVNLLFKNQVDDIVECVCILRVDTLINWRLLLKILNDHQLGRVLNKLHEVLNKEHSVDEVVENV